MICIHEAVWLCKLNFCYIHVIATEQILSDNVFTQAYLTYNTNIVVEIGQNFTFYPVR